MKLAALAADVEAETEGVWSAYVGDFEVRVASSDCPAYQSALASAMKPHLEALRRGELGDEAKQAIWTEVAATRLVRDWRGLEEEDGSAIPFSEDKARELLADPAMHRFRSWVEEKAGEPGRYAKHLKEDSLGN